MEPETFAEANTLTVIVVEDIEDPVGGFANVDQPLNPAHGAWIVVEAAAPLYAFEHELGHAFGLNHFLLGTQNYPHCGGMQWNRADHTSGCICEFNVMGLLLWTTDEGCTCNPDGDATRAFDTPLSADFTAHVARCWLNERRHQQECIRDFADSQTVCYGEEGNLTCHCPDTFDAFLTTQSCSPSATDQFRADAAEQCPVQCNADLGMERYRCQGTPFEVTCECREGGPTFTAPGCSEEYAAEREAAAISSCGIARCVSEIMPEVVCEGVAFQAIPCTCPDGTLFETAHDCSTLDLFVELECGGT